MLLGGKLRQVEVEPGILAWAFSSSKYVQEAVKNVDAELKKRFNNNEKFGNKHGLRGNPKAPLKTDYRPELGMPPELNVIDAAYYQSLIGILRWMAELGRVDMTTEVSVMSSCLALPREGHLEQLFHIFSYLKNSQNSEMVPGPTIPGIDFGQFSKKGWAGAPCSKGDGVGLKEEKPPNAPKARGVGFIVRMFVDSDHAGDKVTRRSRTGFLVYYNNALIYWHSKKQTSIETSSFGSEFMAMKHGTEYVRGLRYKLRMMGIPADFPTFIYADSKSADTAAAMQR